jgi:hypothetical protein
MQSGKIASTQIEVIILSPVYHGKASCVVDGCEKHEISFSNDCMDSSSSLLLQIEWICFCPQATGEDTHSVGSLRKRQQPHLRTESDTVSETLRKFVEYRTMDRVQELSNYEFPACLQLTLCPSSTILKKLENTTL